MSGCRLFPGKFTWAVCALIVLALLAACAGDSKPPPGSPVEPSKVNIEPRFYVVKKGDTLSGIGLQTGHHYRQLAVWNHIVPPYTIYPGQKIRLFGSDASSQSRSSRKTKNKTSTRREGSTRKKTVSRKKGPTVSTNKNKRSPPSAEEKAKKNLKIVWMWPIKGVIVRNYSLTGSKGIDISGKLGQPVRAAAAGKVVYSGQGLAGYGNLVIVKHSEKFLSAYANNRRLLVKEGDHVRKGQTIAEVGAVAGKKPSLYFEIRKFGKPMNPMSYLPNR
jgi:lipoprotein NlpD